MKVYNLKYSPTPEEEEEEEGPVIFFFFLSNQNMFHSHLQTFSLLSPLSLSVYNSQNLYWKRKKGGGGGNFFLISISHLMVKEKNCQIILFEFCFYLFVSKVEKKRVIINVILLLLLLWDFLN